MVPLELQGGEIQSLGGLHLLSLLCPLYSAPSSHHLVARVYESKAEFRSALQHEKEGYTIYKTQVGVSRAGKVEPVLVGVQS